MNHERIILILEFLRKNTNEYKSVTLKEIKEYLYKNTNFRVVSDVTIRRDIDRLITEGKKDIKISSGAHNTARYSLNDNKFTFNEIRFIVDSVSINKYLTDEQKKLLIKKFESMCSESEIRQLISRITLNSTIPPSLSLIENLEKIHNIISAKCRINFEYGKYSTKRNVEYYKKHRETVPVKVEYFDDKFYLHCYNLESEQFRLYRIDRMKNIVIGEKCPQSYSVPKNNFFVSSVFKPDRADTVTIKAERELLDEMLEQFGEYGTVVPSSDDENVYIRVYAGINKQFYLWLLKYGERIEIISPDEARKEYEEIVRKIYEKYIQK